jgi:hypothetical protein
MMIGNEKERETLEYLDHDIQTEYLDNKNDDIDLEQITTSWQHILLSRLN